MKLFACMCNQPQRLPAALAPVRAALVAQPPVSAVGPRLHPGRGCAPRAHAEVERGPGRSRLAAGRDQDRLRDRASRARGPSTVVDGRHRQHAAVPVPPLAVRADRDARSRRDRAEAARARARVPPAQHQGPHAGRADLPRVPRDAPRRGQPRRRRTCRRSPSAARSRPRSGSSTAELEKAGKVGEAAPRLGNVALTNGRSMVLAHLGEPLRLRRLTVTGERGRA